MSPAVAAQVSLEGLLEALRVAVETAAGPQALVIVFVYSFLIAVVLPLPSEVVLLADLGDGVGLWPELGLIMLVSGTGKALGSVLALRLGHEAKSSGPVIRLLERSRFDVVAWSERKTVQIAQDYGFIGLALALCVPFFPDTLSIYGFAVLEDDYLKFGLATFAGSVGRLVVTVLLAGGVAAFV